MFVSRFCAVIVSLIIFPLFVYSGDLDSPAAPTDTGSAMYTLTDIYNRLNEGTTTAKRTGAFTEPTDGPGAATGRTLNEIMAIAPAKDDTDGASASHVLSGKTFWGLTTAGWGTQTGSIETQTLSSGTTTVNAGYYEATDLASVDTDLDFAGMAIWAYTDIGYGIENTALIIHEWEIEEYNDPVFTINGRAISVPSQPYRPGETRPEPAKCFERTRQSGSNGLSLNGLNSLQQGAFIAENGGGVSESGAAVHIPMQASYGKLPLYFIQNDGQTDEQVKYYERSSGHSMFFTKEGIYLFLQQRENTDGLNEWNIETQGIASLHDDKDEKKSPLTKGDKGGCENPQPRYPERSHAGQASPAELNSTVPNRCTIPERIRLFPLGANKDSEIIAEEPQKGMVNYFIGNNPGKWRTNIPTFGAVVYKNIYDGVDMRFYGNNRRLEYDIIVQPGVSPSRVQLCYEGIRNLRVRENGDMEIVLKEGSVIQKKPFIYQVIAGKKVEIEGEFRILKGSRVGNAYPTQFGHVSAAMESSFEPSEDMKYEVQVANLNPQEAEDSKVGNAYPTDSQLPTQNSQLIYGFRVASYEKSAPLVIDPTLEYSTYLGGSGSDVGYSIAVDGTGSANVTGYTASNTDFPIVGTTTGYGSGTYDVFVTKLGTSGSSIEYSTYLGGSSNDRGYGIAVDGSGSAYVTGYTQSSNFPIVGTTTAHGGGTYDAFVIKLGTSGSSIEYSTYLGGNQNEEGYDIAVDGTGSAYVTGYTRSSNFPIVGTTTGYSGPYDVFVTKLGTSGSNVEYSICLGGGDGDAGDVSKGYGIAVDGTGSAYVTGEAWGKFPIVGTTTVPGSRNAFVTKLGTRTTDVEILYSIYLGGYDIELGYDIAVDDAGFAYVTGFTTGNGFPIVGTTTGYGGGGNNDAFVTKLGTSGSSIEYSICLGGSGHDYGYGIAVDGTGYAYVTGYTQGNGFPIVGTTTEYGGNYDAFVAKLGTRTTDVDILYSTYLGGTTTDYGYGIAVDGTGSAYVTGYTESGNFPIVGTTTGYGDSGDAFVSKLAHSTPWAVTGAADVTTNSATLNATVSAMGLPTTAMFSYGVSSGSYTGTSTTQSVTGQNETVNIGISGLSAGATYYYRIVANNSLGTSTGSEQFFTTTSSGGGGWEPPEVTLSISSTEPAKDEKDVSVDTIVSAKFSMLINGTTVTTDSIYVKDPDGNKIEGTASTDYYTATFTPASNLSYGATYTAIATTKIQAANWAGTQMDDDYSWSFTTESQPATPAPATTASPTPTPATTPTPVVVITTTAIPTPTLIPSPTGVTTPTPVSTATVTASPTPAATSTVSPAPTPSPTPNPTPTPVSEGVLSLSKEIAYLAGDTVIVTVADGDRNTSTQAEEILATAIKVAGDNYYIGNDLLLDLNEEGADSGTFLATIKTGTATSGGAGSTVRSNTGTVYAIQYGTVTVAYSPDSSVSVTKKLSFSSFDATLAFDRPVYLAGTYAEVTLSDAESNADHKEVETLLGQVYVQTSQFNTAGVWMMETGTDTGVFLGSIQISADFTLDYDRIQAAGGYALTASYYDETTTTGFPLLVTDTCSVATMSVPTVTPTLATPVPSPAITPSPNVTPSIPVLAPTPSTGACDDAEKITVSPSSLELEKGEEGEVTVAVTDGDGCGIEGIRVKRKITTANKKKIRVKVKPSNRKTDAEGKAVFTITAKKDKCTMKDNCNAKVQFKAKGVKKKAEVVVWLIE